MNQPTREQLRTAASTCGLCSLACPLELQVAGGTLAASRTLGGAEPTCPRGACGPALLQGEARLRLPRIRTGSEQREVGWPVAIATAASKLERCIAEHGPNAVAVLCSGSVTLEAAWVLRQIAQEGLETTWLGSLGGAIRQGPRRDLDPLLGRTASTCTREDLELADTILVVGADPERTHPELAASLERAAADGAHLAVLHSSHTRAVYSAEHWVDARRGTLSTQLASLLVEVVRAGEEEISPSPALAEACRQLIDEHDVEEAARTAGTRVEDIETLARQLCETERLVAVYDLDDTTERSSGDLLLLAALLAVLGKLSRSGSGLLLLRSEANDAGLDLAELRQDISSLLRDGEPKGLLVIGEDPLMRPELAPRLRDLDALVVLDAHDSLTAEMADVVLPVPSLAETAGTIVACDGQVRRLESALPPAAGKSLLSVLTALGEQLGTPAPSQAPARIREEISVELGRDSAWLDRLGERGGTWAWRPVACDQELILEPAPGCWPVLEHAWSRLAGLLHVSRQRTARREAS